MQQMIRMVPAPADVSSFPFCTTLIKYADGVGYSFWCADGRVSRIVGDIANFPDAAWACRELNKTVEREHVAQIAAEVASVLDLRQTAKLDGSCLDIPAFLRRQAN